MAEKISSNLIGLESDPIEVEWCEKDAQLYALAVGAMPEDDLDFIYENRGPKVLPTFGVVPGLNIMGGVLGKVEINLAMLLHGEQAITLHRPLPATVKATAVGKITEIWDKGKAAVIGLTGEVSDKDGLLYTTHATLFIRGAGGFGGERGPSSEETKVVIPEGEPDFTVEETTLEQQAALYRLTGDRNPIHIDPQFAKFGGYDKPFLHGLCSYGFAGRALLKTLCGGDPAKFGSMTGRFSDQVYPGDQLITKIWKTGKGEAVYTMETQKGNIVLNQAKATFTEE
ncbi:MAG: MaoC family dehydratase N-terminal domain-containing protein [Pseudomonadales bacterium]|nr:MaoC family dehydratase N-terminal domain-containing protein [Pseudomonadales bacterium]